MIIIETKTPLYKKTSTGAIQEWQISVVYRDSNYYVMSVWGQIKGKKQETEEIITEGKNIGRSNATTPEEQAILRMCADWTKKLKKGYVESVYEAENDIVNSIIKGGIVPMTAKVYQKDGKKIKFPAIAQPKLDGHRSTSQKKETDYSLWSRSRKEILSVPHIIAALDLVDLDKLDGELYNHDYRDDFEVLTSLIKQENPVEGHEKVQLHVYDVPHPTLTNYERYLLLESLRSTFIGSPIHIVESIIVNNEAELREAYKYFMVLGYEGAMVRNFDGLYVNKKSADLQKFKEFDDFEFEVTNVKVATKGKMAGLGVFICKTIEGNRFDCKMKGELKELKKYADNPELAIGRQLTVQFQGYTTKNKVPRFPVGLRFREDI